MCLILPMICLTYPIMESFFFFLFFFFSKWSTSLEQFLRSTVWERIFYKKKKNTVHQTDILALPWISLMDFHFYMFCSHHFMPKISLLFLLTQIYLSWLSLNHTHFVYDYAHPFYAFFTCTLHTFLFMHGFFHNRMANSLKD